MRPDVVSCADKDSCGSAGIDFATPGEFPSRAGAVIYAPHNDYESIAKVIARSEDPEESPTVGES